jgi:uncharacterized protein YjbI with pentapeptide repeats
MSTQSSATPLPPSGPAKASKTRKPRSQTAGRSSPATTDSPQAELAPATGKVWQNPAAAPPPPLKRQGEVSDNEALVGPPLAKRQAKKGHAKKSPSQKASKAARPSQPKPHIFQPGWPLLVRAGQALVLPVVIGLGVLWLTQDIEQSQRQLSDITQNRQSLENYLDSISDLLLEQKLLPAAADPPGWSRQPIHAVRVKTLTTLRTLAGDQKGTVVRFLHESCLLKARRGPALLDCQALPLISMAGADLRQVNLTHAWLPDISLAGAFLNGADLSGADLSRAKLARADFSGYASASAVHWLPFRASEPQALQPTNLQGANLQLADLSGANLSGANLRQANLRQANLSGARFDARTDLAGANLQGALGLMPEQVQQAKNWQQAQYAPDMQQQLGL